MNVKADRVLFTDAPTVGAVGSEFNFGADLCVAMRGERGAAVNFNQLMRTSALSAVAARPEPADRP
ncbi:MAG: hypothetical protein ABSE69_17530, partial [Roseiarcus sp.]